MKLTIFLILLCIIGFITPFFVFQNIDDFYNIYGFSGKNLLERPYVLVTSIFMHGSVEHLLVNILVLFFFGIAVESELGKLKMLLIFFLGAFTGDLLSLFAYPFDSIAIGASAGIFALMGVGMLVRPFDLSFYPLIIPIPLVFLGMAYIFFNAYEFIVMPNSNISYIAHFGGFFVGLLFGFGREGWKKGLKIILIALTIMIIIPLLRILFF
ncbi:MAG: rhomboid family intramembrane serine protease [Candidatus Aenigmatarchaeota archaeon]